MDTAPQREDRGDDAGAQPAGPEGAVMWWLILIIVLVIAAIVGALVVTRRRASLGMDPSGGDFTGDQRNKSTVSDPNTGLGPTSGLGGL